MRDFFSPPYWGKLLGFLAGLMFGRLPGALLGLWLGHRFDRGLARQWASSGGLYGMFGSQSARTQHAVFFHATFAVMGHLAKASGRVSESEITLATRLMDRMQLSAEARRQAQDAFREGKMAGFPLLQVLRELRQAVAGRHDMLQFFLEVQLQLALADGQLTDAERHILEQIAHELGFSSDEMARLLAVIRAAQHQRQRRASAGSSSSEGSRDRHARPVRPPLMTMDEACGILGVSPGSSPIEIKRAYRRQMAQHHPDKLEARGLPPEMKQLAVETSQQLQQAYQVIKTRRQFR